MSKLTVLIMGVETSDQMGTSEEFVVGVFDGIGDIALAKKEADAVYSQRRTYFREVDLEINTIYAKRLKGRYKNLP